MMKAMVILIVAILFLAIPFASAEIIISEIMYAPVVNENYNEWIEIYNSGNDEINLNGWTLCGKEILEGYVDHAKNETFKKEGLVLEAGKYAIITDGGTGTDVYSNFDIDEDALSLSPDSSSLCSGLSNTGKEISLSSNETSYNVIYTAELANKNNKSLQYNGTGWCEGIPTPGKENECPATISCGDGICNGDETCASCEEDCLNEDEICCEDVAYEGECCSNDECSEGYLCQDNVCIKENNTNTESEETNNETNENIENKTQNTTTKTTVKNVSENKTKITNLAIEQNETKNVVYQSKNDRMKDTALYLAIGLFIVLFIYIIKSDKL